MSTTAPSEESASHEPTRPCPLLVPRSELSWLALTSDQARILQRIIHDNRSQIRRQWSDGIFDGLGKSLHEVERAGGAYIRELPSRR